METSPKNVTGDERGGTCMNGATPIVFFLPEPLQARLFDLLSRRASAARTHGADRYLGNTCADGDYAWPPVIALDAQTGYRGVELMVKDTPLQRESPSAPLRLCMFIPRTAGIEGAGFTTKRKKRSVENSSFNVGILAETEH